MICIRLSGGLGNQMYQYAFGRALSEVRQSPLVLNCHGLNNKLDGVTPRSYSLGSFFLNDSVRVSDSRYSFLLNRLAKHIPLVDRLLSVRFEKNLSYDPSVLIDSHSYIFDGYWQSHRYFQHISEVLCKEFQFRGQFSDSFLQYKRDIYSGPSVMLHVRRGDYISLSAAASHHGVLELSYYKFAVDKVLNQDPHARFFVFSDDIGWCRQSLSFLPIDTRFIEPDAERCDVQELILMSLCRHQIIANSSFSWWSAWLANANQREYSGMTFAPKAWFAHRYVDQNSRFPENWNVL